LETNNVALEKMEDSNGYKKKTGAKERGTHKFEGKMKILYLILNKIGNIKKVGPTSPLFSAGKWL